MTNRACASTYMKAGSALKHRGSRGILTTSDTVEFQVLSVERTLNITMSSSKGEKFDCSVLDACIKFLLYVLIF